MSLVDRKYMGIITKADGTVVNDWIVFRAKDKLVLDMLIHYLGLCSGNDCEQQHIDSIHKLIARVRAYQKEFSEKVKLPDTREEDIIIHALDLAEEEKEVCWFCGGKDPNTEITVECDIPNGEPCEPKVVKVHMGCYMEVNP